MTTMNKQPKQVLIVGGGISGLSTAFFLLQKSQQLHQKLECTIVEADSRWGGKILTHHDNGLLIEGGPDSFLSSKPWALALCEQLGLNQELLNTTEGNNKTYIFSRGKLREFPQGLVAFVPTQLGPLFRNGLLSWPGILRMGGDWVLPPKKEFAKEESLAAFFRRRLGHEAFNRLIEPLVAGIYAGNAEEMSLAATFPRFAEIEQQHGGLIKGMLAQRKTSMPSKPTTGPKRTLFVTLQNGLGDLVDTLVQRLTTHGATLLTNQKAVTLHPEASAHGAGGYQVTLSDGSIHRTDAVVFSTPAYSTAALINTMNPDAASVLEDIPYASTGTISLSFRHHDVQSVCRGFGFVVPRIEQRSLIAATWTSLKWANRAPADECLIRCYVGGRGREDVFQFTDEELVEHVRTELQAIIGLTAQPRHALVSRWMRAMPQYTLGHLERVQKIRTALDTSPGVFVTGAAYEGIGIPDCIREAERTSSNLVSFLWPSTH
ncbi:MAG: protoporphyrinogen oxidase [Nitrospirales bacterium]|nr:protoporphyrinogen oxidase [Nitrospirales bacterium]